MKLVELRLQVLQPSDLVQVIKNSRLVYVGQSFMTPKEYEEAEVKGMSVQPEVRKKGWEASGLWAPLNESDSQKIKLADAEVLFFYRIKI